MPNKPKIKVLFLSAEVAPLAKVGGLGDVAGSLPKALAGLGIDIRICLPFYGLIDKRKYPAEKIISRLAVTTGDKDKIIDVYKTNLPGTKIPVYLIEHKFFSSSEIYSGPRLILNGKYTRQPDDLKRFAFFSRAALAVAKKLNFKPDVMHLNDWHTAPVAGFIKTLNQQDNFFAKTKTLLTIHNLANQGINKNNNYLADGILNADLINTVSPTYAKEILTKEYGANLEKILKKRKKDLYGILNGIDTGFFNPATDNLISQKYSFKNLEKKTANKLALQKQLGLPLDKNMALVGLISRLVWQKGLNLITENFSQLNCQFVFLGTGQKEYEQQLLSLSKKFPRQFSALIKFDEKLAHQIYAGADIFLMPSRFEPCGLGQIIAMRYGSVPLVRKTGGLADTVNHKVGFAFKKYSGQELYKTIDKALTVFYKNKKFWRRLQLNGLKQDFSWNKPAHEYLKLYKKLKK
ncbi:MAG: glycogen/starch synthase [Patescibacteria group bacterium]|nr:glycogen/starch synthase [Patescibacteria group bacterium]